MPQNAPGITPEEVLRLAGGGAIRPLFELAVRLDLFAKLSGKQVSLEELPEIWEMPASPARFMGQFLANVKLLTYRDGLFANSPLTEAVLTRRGPIRRALLMPLVYDLSYDEVKEQMLNPPVAQWYQLRDEGTITDERAILRQNTDEWHQGLIQRRHEPRIEWGKALTQVYDLSGHKKLVDLGGASGGYCLGFRQVHPHLQCTVFDLPPVAAFAREKIEEAGESEHIQVVEGSFFEDEFPRGDVILLAQVIHNWNRDDDLLILRKIYAALEDGGTLLVHEKFFEDDWSGSLEAVFYAFLMVGKEDKCGWQPSYGETEELLREVGFTDVERRPDLVIGRKG